MNEQAPTYKNHRCPISIVARAIWLYFRGNISLREVEEMMLGHGVEVSYETIRRWYRSHGSLLTARLNSKTPSTSDEWRLNEVVVNLGGKNCWLWRAVDQDGFVLDEIVQTRRNTKTAKRFGVSAASVSSWRNLQLQKGNVCPCPLGGDRNSYKTEAYADQIITWLGDYRDGTLFEPRNDLAAQGIVISKSALRRFLVLHEQTRKKDRPCGRAKPFRHSGKAATLV